MACRCTSQGDNVEKERLVTLYDVTIPAERRDVARAQEECKVALGGGDPEIIARSAEEAYKYLAPLPPCNRYLSARSRLERDTANFDQRLTAYNNATIPKTAWPYAAVFKTPQNGSN